MAAAKPHTIYEFGGFRLDPLRHQLLDPAGVPVPLSSRAFDALVFLASHAGEVLDRSKLLRSIWPTAVVEENTLTQHISALRRALGDGRNGERFILTVAGRGYQFVAEVRQHTDPASYESHNSTSPVEDTSESTRRRGTSFAVLPFTNLSGDPAKEYFAEGIAEELIHKLARVPGVRVSARTSSFAYKKRDMDVRKVARELDVTWVLEGSVRSAGERIRITVQLIDGTTGFHVWSQSYDRRFEDLFALQDEIANAIVAIHPDSPPGEIAKEAPDRRVPTRDLQAYQLYLQGRALALRAGRDNLRLARGVLSEALARDPAFARAYAALAVVFLHEFTMGTAGAEAHSQAREMALKALQLDADLPEAHATLGVITADRGEWLTAHEHFRVALATDPGDGFIHHSFALSLLANAGHVLRALDHACQSCRLSPGDPGFPLVAACQCVAAARNTEAGEHLTYAFRLGITPDIVLVQCVLAWTAWRDGHVDQACNAMIATLPPDVRDAGGAEAIRAVYAGLVDVSLRSKALLALDSKLAGIFGFSLDRSVTIMHVVIWYTMLGAIDRAYQVLERQLEQKVRAGLVGRYWHALWFPELRPLRQHPAFQSLVERLNLIQYWKVHGAPDGCDLHDGTLIVH